MCLKTENHLNNGLALGSDYSAVHMQDLLIRNFDVDCFAGVVLPAPKWKVV